MSDDRREKLALAIECMQRQPILAEMLPVFERHTQAALDLWRVVKMDQEGGGNAEMHLDVPPAAPLGKEPRPARSRLVLRPAVPDPKDLRPKKT